MRVGGREQRILTSRVEMTLRGQEILQRTLRDEFASGRAESGRAALELRAEVSGAVERMGDSLRQEVDRRLQDIRVDNERRLEQIRSTVDGRLQATLEQRLGESFRQVSDRLEKVHQGLGEMHALAAGVGDLKRVLANVKTRGTWGEVQLSRILEEVLTPDQYQANVATRRESSERVEYAVRLPGRDGGPEAEVWLPIDAKFPLEDYQRMLDAQDRCDTSEAEAAARALESRVKACARDISRKYLAPPCTTDFGIMFLPTEGLYAEVLRRPGLADTIQQEHRILVAGPTTLAALLNSLQMGFRTLAIEQRSSEVWELLGAVRTQFGQFGDVLDKVQKRLHSASQSIEDAARKSRRIERSLYRVEEVPPEP
ncbi:MAG: DNA recombination protein RmuC [Actinobacteria bacterium]|nr:DNA recombination protein RmuC [Actinomycetota bacterium]